MPPQVCRTTLLFVFLIALIGAACENNDNLSFDQMDDDAANDDVDDDATDDDLDDDLDDDVDDDVDDDTVDDDTIDDDTVDDDTIDDDTIDDDTIDDDTIDDDSVDDDTVDDDTAPDDDTANELVMELVDGGWPGHEGLSLAQTGPDTWSMVAIKSDWLYLYTIEQDTVVAVEPLFPCARHPALVADSTGALHVFFLNRLTDWLGYGTNAKGEWSFEDIGSTGSWGSQPTVLVDADDNLHVVFTAAASGLAYTTNQSGAWVTETINDTDQTWEPSLAADAQGFLHIVATDGDNHSLLYSTNKTGAWQTETIAEAGPGVQYPHLRLGPDAEFQIQFYNYDDQQLIFLTNKSGGWQREVLYQTPHMGIDAAFAVDDNGFGYIAGTELINYERSRLLFWSNESGSWTMAVVDGFKGAAGKSIVVAPNAWLALDADGEPHIGHFDVGSGELKVAYRENDVWTKLVVDGAGKKGSAANIAVDARGRSHVAHRDDSDEALYYATNAGGRWVDAKIDAAFLHNLGVGDIAVDADGAAHISYYLVHEFLPVGRLMYASNESSAWQSTAIDAPSIGEYAGYDSGIGVDQNGAVHIVYLSHSNATELNSVHYATNQGGSWKTSEIVADAGFTVVLSMVLDADGALYFCFDRDHKLNYGTNRSGTWVIEELADMGQANSNAVAVDAAGYVHILYFYAPETGDYEIRYITNAGGSWVDEQVDAGYVGGMYLSLVVDDEGRAHATYMDPVYEELIYATNMSGGWITTRLDYDGYSGAANSLAIDGNGRLHAAYECEGALWVASFPRGWPGE